MSQKTATPVWEDQNWRARVSEFARKIGFAPAHEGLVLQALTHRSIADLTPWGDNERLEFLGDSVLALLVNEHLYRTNPDYAEGQLTKLKQRYVSEPTLAEAARVLELGTLLVIAPGDEAAGGRSRPSTLSDAFEAVVAALYLAGGLDAARDFVHRFLITRVNPDELWDHKSRLQELLQDRLRITPSYHTEAESGPAHDRVFYSEARAEDRLLGSGRGKSKKLAEQAAAADALERLDTLLSQFEVENGSAASVPAEF